MVSVATEKNEILAKQIEVKATGASDVKIYANGANQKTSGVEATDNSSNKTCLPGGCVKPSKGENDLFGINRPKKENPFGKFDINGNGKLDREELVAMLAYIKELMTQKTEKPEKVNPFEKINKPEEANKDLLLILIGLLIGQVLAKDSETPFDRKKDFLQVA